MNGTERIFGRRAASKTKMANLNKTQLIIFGVIGAVALLAVLMITGIIPGLNPPETKPFTLEIWSPFDPPEVWSALAEKYRAEKEPAAAINYVKKDAATYETELVNALASGKGPDVFFLKDSDLQKHSDKIKPLADGELGYEKKNLRSVFADALLNSITKDSGELLGTPMSFDTLALFYNRDYFNSANIAVPPATWDELIESAKKLTKVSEVGGLSRAGVALGTASNVDYAGDILLALIYQARGEVIDAKTGKNNIASPETVSALLFYTSFSNSTKKTYSWNGFFAKSLQAFARGDAAMAFGYSSDVKKINELNPHLNFDVSPLPQPNLNDPQVNFGRFGMLVVSRLSSESDNAWNFLLWLEGKDPQKQYIDALGLAPARRDLASAKPPREYLTTFYDQVLSARTTPVLIAFSLDQILSDMIENVVNRKFSVSNAIDRAEADLNEILLPRPQ